MRYFRLFSVAAIVLLLAPCFSVAQETCAPTKKQIAIAERSLRADKISRHEARQIVQTLVSAARAEKNAGAIVYAAREIAQQYPDHRAVIAGAAARLAPAEAIRIAGEMAVAVVGVAGEGVVEQITKDSEDGSWVITLSESPPYVFVLVERSAQRHLKQPKMLTGKTIRFDGLGTTYRGKQAVRISEAERLKVVE